MQIDVGGYELRAEVSGEGETAFLCLHGLVDTLRIWDRLARLLETRGRVVRIDQRGHGESTAPPGPCSLADLARDAAAVLDALGIDEAIFVGHSMGGIVAMTAALECPERVRALVLIGTASQCSERVAAWYGKIAQAGETEGTAGLARTIYRDPAKRIEGDAAAIAGVTRALRELYETPLTPRLGSLRCPTLLLVGENDPMGAKASTILHDAIPGSALRSFPGRGHWLHVEAPEDVAVSLDLWQKESP